MDHLATEEIEGEKRQQGGDAGHGGAGQSLVDAPVEKIGKRHLPEFAQVLADPVIDHHGIVDGVASDSEDSGNGGQIELKLKDGEQADSSNHVMHQRHHRANTKLPLETEPYVNHNRQQRQAHGPGPGLDQFRAHLGANELRAPVVGPLSQGFLDGGNRRQLRLFVTFLALDTDKDVFGFAKFLDFHLAKVQPVKLRAQGRNIGDLFELHVDHDAALEINSEIKAAYGEKKKGQKNHR